MKNNLKNSIVELQKIAENSQKTFGNLSPVQINWKSSAESWSIGQCFKHLIKSNELLYDKFDELADGKHNHSLLERFSPLSGFFGNLLISSLKKDARKFKAPTKKIVPPSEIDPQIIEIFARHQAELIGKFKKIAAADWSKIKITSPYLKFVTYRLSDGLTIVVEHEKRHFRQAERTAKGNNFPN